MSLFSIAQELAQSVTLEVNDQGITLFYRDHEPEEASVDVIAQRLASYIYADFHAGFSSMSAFAGIRLGDPALENALEAVTPKKYREVRARYVRDLSDQTASEVEIGGVRVVVELPSGSSPRKSDDIVSIAMPAWRPRLSPGFFFTESAERPFVAMGPIVRLYVHIDNSADAPPAWGAVTAHLYELGVPFKVKILSVAGMYPRNDALVVYLTRPSWPHLADLAERLSRLPGVVPGTSVFAREVRPGVGLAFEPIDSRDQYRRMSFGQHRAMIVANTLVDRAIDEERDGDALASRAHLALVDLDDPWRNTSSPDVLLHF